ncbi:coproporphyrinogen III oxidase [Akkermansiaceae bacterium]|nr:coproporphyrinogen III oxidase [Akkermansiaceae bacterium]
MSKSPRAVKALELVRELQSLFVCGLEGVSAEVGEEILFEDSSWLRDEGRHGGGSRFTAPIDREGCLFDRASVNVSQIHYDDEPTKKLGSATALSCIIHPANAHASSIHMHISWTEMKDGTGYWRMMADLNPSIPNPEQTARFQECLRSVVGEFYEEGSAQGDRYFYIPALERHRGASHFYLENFSSGDEVADREMAKSLGMAVIESYLMFLKESIKANPTISDSSAKAQLDYHTLYFFQVLTLDRGTTSGLLVHDQNDLGIMGSLPSHIDKALLSSWRAKLPSPQEELLDDLLSALSDEVISPVSDEVKLAVAKAVRNHYKKHPDAISLQASGNVVPPTVANHR